jgi:hypothetical protein
MPARPRRAGPAQSSSQPVTPLCRKSSGARSKPWVTVVQSRRLCCDLALHRLDFSGTARRPGSRRAKTAFGRHTDMPRGGRPHRPTAAADGGRPSKEAARDVRNRGQGTAVGLAKAR